MSVDAHRQCDGESPSPTSGAAHGSVDHGPVDHRSVVVHGSVERGPVDHPPAPRRAPADAEAHVGYLLDRLHRSHSEERRRVARELHDRVAHAIAVVLQELELSAALRPRDAELADRRQATATAALRDVLDLLRSITQELRVSGADDGVGPALRSYLASTGLERRTDLMVTGDEATMAPAVRGELFLIVREALRNAERHAAAGRIQVQVTIGDAAVRAEVSDDGRGFEPTTPPRPGAGIGLSVMRERAALLGGTVDVRSQPGNGTSVSVRVPLMRAWDDSDN